jgi:hypothetical protein
MPRRKRQKSMHQLSVAFWERLKKALPVLQENALTSDGGYIQEAYKMGFEAAERRYKRK